MKEHLTAKLEVQADSDGQRFLQSLEILAMEANVRVVYGVAETVEHLKSGEQISEELITWVPSESDKYKFAVLEKKAFIAVSERLFRGSQTNGARTFNTVHRYLEDHPEPGSGLQAFGWRDKSLAFEGWGSNYRRGILLSALPDICSELERNKLKIAGLGDGGMSILCETYRLAQNQLLKQS